MEAVSLCLCGVLLGVGCGWLSAHGLARLAVHLAPIVPEWPIVFPFSWVLISVIFSGFIGIIFGVYPAMRAGRLLPIDALRTEN